MSVSYVIEYGVLYMLADATHHYAVRVQQLDICCQCHLEGETRANVLVSVHSNALCH